MVYEYIYVKGDKVIYEGKVLTIESFGPCGFGSTMYEFEGSFNRLRSYNFTPVNENQKKVELIENDSEWEGDHSAILDDICGKNR